MNTPNKMNSGFSVYHYKILRTLEIRSYPADALKNTPASSFIKYLQTNVWNYMEKNGSDVSFSNLASTIRSFVAMIKIKT